MIQPTHEPPIPARRSPAPWGLGALAAGALILILAALAVLPLAARREPLLAPTSTPEGVVQRYFEAAYRGDYAAAYAMLSAETQREVTLAELQARLRYERDSEMRVDAVTVHGATATVSVSVTHYSPGGLFGASEWTARSDVLLVRDGDTWRITGEPLW